MIKRMIPLGDSILVLPDAAETVTESGFILTNAEMTTTGTVQATGPGKLVDGEMVQPQLKPGDKIMFAGINVNESLRLVTLNDVRYLLMLESQIFGIIEED
jgi:co-chaperonin GroES (HSP10)